MRNLGASYFGKSDDDAAGDWFRIAALASQVGDNAEKADTATAYESLANGKGIPDGMSDTVRINAKKMLADNLQGETVAAEQQIMADIASKAKEQGVSIHDYLKGNVESYLTTPASYRAVGNISKMFQERQLADASYQKAKMEEGVNRFKEVSSLVQAADGLYKKGDLEGSRKMVEQISRIVPIPGFAKTNDETGELEGYATDFDKGGHKPSGMKFDVGGFLNAAKQVTRDEFAYGYALNSQVVNEMNAKNLAEASIMKDKGGGRYMGFNFVNPYDATDTKFIVKQEGTGKTVGQFASIQDATNSGYTPYNQKYEEGELKMSNMKSDQRMQEAEHGARMKGFGLDQMIKQLEINDRTAEAPFKEKLREHQLKKADYEESLYPTKEEIEKTKLEKMQGKNRMTDDKFSEAIIKSMTSEGTSTSSDDQIRALSIAKEARPFFDDHVMPSVASEMLPRVNAAIQNGTSPDEAIKNMVASKLGMSRAVYDLQTNKSYTPEQKAEILKNIRAGALSEATSKNNNDTINTLLESLYSMDTNNLSDYADSAVPSFIYDKRDNRADVLYALGKATGFDAENVNNLYQEYVKKRNTGSSPSIEAENRRIRDEAAKRNSVKQFTGRETGMSMEEKFGKWLERNGLSGY